MEIQTLNLKLPIGKFIGICFSSHQHLQLVSSSFNCFEHPQEPIEFEKTDWAINVMINNFLKSMMIIKFDFIRVSKLKNLPKTQEEMEVAVSGTDGSTIAIHKQRNLRLCQIPKYSNFLVPKKFNLFKKHS